MVAHSLEMANTAAAETKSTVLNELKTKAEETKEALKTKGEETKDTAEETKKALKTKGEETKEMAVAVVRDMKAKAHKTMDSTMVTLRDPHFQTCTIATAGGAITLGTAGGAFGLASGVAVGSSAGVLPALLTFGLSIPAGGVIGGTCGLCAGTLLGGASGGISGFTIYKYRIEIKDGIVSVKVHAHDALTGTKDRLVMVSSATKARIETQVCKVTGAVSDAASNTKKNSLAAVDLAKAKASGAFNFATHTRAGVTSSSAIAGAVVGGTSTGAFGTVAGAALGVVPAIFTFGLSIPAGAMMGLCVGTTVGGSAGAVGGGLTGYTGFTHREAISEGFQSSCTKVSNTAGKVKTRTFTVAAKAKQSVNSMIRGSTGGSSEEN